MAVLIMYENSATYTWWDIEDSVGSLAMQAVDRWEALGLPKDVTENPVILRVWVTPEEETVYTITLERDGLEVYTAEGAIKIYGVSSRIAAMAEESAIFERAAELVGETAADKLVEGLLSWLHQ